MMVSRLCFAVAALLILLGGARAADSSGNVYSVNYPLHYFATVIGGTDVSATFPIPSNVDPAYWEPNAEQILDFQGADLVLLNGAGYAKWIQNAALPRSRVVNTSRAFTERLITEDRAVTHSHGPEGEHAHAGGYAFTTWLDIALAREQAAAVKTAFEKRWPELTPQFEERHAALDAELARLEGTFESSFKALAGKHVLGSHPVYQYLARAQDLEMTSFHWEPDQTPPPSEWADLDKLLAKRPASLMLWEGEPTPETRKMLAERGVAVAVLPTVSNRPETGDFVSELSRAAAALPQTE